MDGMVSRFMVQTNYNRLSRYYDFFSQGSERKFINLGLKELAPQPGENILEIGYGTGYGLISIAKMISPSGCIVGIDLSSGMANIAKEKIVKSGTNARVFINIGDATHLPHISGYFDAIFMSFTLELFTESDIPRVLQECVRVLRDNGRLGIISMHQTKTMTLSVQIYEWLRRKLPNLIDCRPIPLETYLDRNGFNVSKIAVKSMWGLPVSIAVAHKCN